MTYKNSSFKGGEVYFVGGADVAQGAVDCDSTYILTVSVKLPDKFNEVWESLRNGETPTIKLRFTPSSGLTTNNFSDTNWLSACTSKWPGIVNGTHTVQTQEVQITANTIRLSKTTEKVENDLGAVLQDELGSVFSDNFDTGTWYRNLSNDDKLAVGCATIGGTVNCDEPARRKLFTRLVGMCWRQAEDIVSKRTFGDTSDAAVRDHFAGCISDATGAKKADVLSVVRDVSREEMRNIIEAAKKSVEDELNAQVGTTATQSQPSCGTEVSSVGWILCPVLEAITGVADTIWGIFEVLMVTQPLKQGTPIHGTWSNICGLANAMLVIIFLIIVYSQITNTMLGNYGVKQALPKFILVAVAVNTSFFLMQVSFDMANILGKSIDNLILSQVSTIQPNWGIFLTDLITHGITIAGVGTLAAAGGVVAAGGIGPFLIFLTILLVPAILAFAAGTIALIVRTALIPMLAAFSPLALAMAILPNTQFIFDKWKKVFFGLLFLYPLASIYFGALKFAAYSLLQNSTPSGTFDRLIGLLLLMFGAGVIPWIAIKANSITGRMAGMIQGGLAKMTSPAVGIADRTAKSMQQVGRARFMTRDFSGRGGNMFRRISRSAARRTQGVMRRFDESRRLREIDQANYESAHDAQFKRDLAGGVHSSRLRSIGDNVPGAVDRLNELAHSVTSTEIKNAQITMSSSSVKELESALRQAFTSGDSVRARAAQNLLLSERGSAGVSAFSRTVQDIEKQSGGAIGGSFGKDLRANISNNAAAMDADPALIGWSTNTTSLDAERSAHIQRAAADGGIAADKFAKMTADAQSAMLGSGLQVLTQGHISSLLDTGGTYYGKLTPGVISQLEAMRRK